MSYLDSVAPLITTKKVKTKPTAHWRNDKIKQLKRNCRMAERKLRKNKLSINFQSLQEQFQIYNTTVKQARNNYVARLITENKNNPRFDHFINPDFNKHRPFSNDVKNLQTTSGTNLILLDPAFYLTTKQFLMNPNVCFYLRKH